MSLPPVQPGPHHPQPRPGNPRVEHAETGQDRGFQRVLAVMRGRPEARPKAIPLGKADGQTKAEDCARVFNEDGFFPSSGSPFAEGGEDPAIPHISGRQDHRLSLPAPLDETSAQAIADAESQLLPSKGGKAGAPISEHPVSRAGGAGTPAQEEVANWTMPPPLDVANAAPSQAPMETDTEGATPFRTPRNPSAAEGSLNVQVSLAADGENLSLSIRLGKLSREQRARLRLEIAQLLARYGMTAAEIRLNGEIDPEREL